MNARKARRAVGATGSVLTASAVVLSAGALVGGQVEASALALVAGVAVAATTMIVRGPRPDREPGVHLLLARLEQSSQP